MKKIIGTAAVTALLTAVFVLATACSGIFGGDTRVLITVPGLSDGSAGRFVTTDAVTGYVVLARGNKIDSLGEYSSVSGAALKYAELTGGTAVLSGIIPDDYTIGVALVDDNSQPTGLAIKNLRVKPGFNSAKITMGPGYASKGLVVGGMEIKDPVRSGSNYSLTFAQDTVIIDFDRKGETVVKYVPTFGDASKAGNRAIRSVAAKQIGGSGEGDSLNRDNDGEVRVPADAGGVEFTATDSNGDTYIFRVILK